MKTLLLAVLLAACARTASAQVGILNGRVAVPQVPKSMAIAEPEMDFRFFKKYGKQWEGMADASLRWQGERKEGYRSLTMGPYYRAHKNLKVGAFYKLQYGMRHDGDWSETKDNLGWAWNDTRERAENLFILDASPRMAVPWVDDVTATLKLQFEHNWFNGHERFRINPDITYHWVQGLKPVASISLQWDAFTALNFGHEVWNDQWVYLGGLWHAHPKVSFGPRVGMRRWVWTDTPGFQAVTNRVSYRVVYQAFVLGLDTVIRL